MANSNEEEALPSWMDTENDELHRKEVAPLLFGTGKINMADRGVEKDEDVHDDDNDSSTNGDDGFEENQEDVDETDVETAVSTAASVKSNSKPKNYGSVGSSASKSPSKKNLWPFSSNDKGLQRSKSKSRRSVRRGSSKKNVVEDDDDDWPNATVTYNETTGRPERPTRGWCLDVFFFIEGCAILTCVSLLATQVLPLILIPISEIEPVTFVLKIYISLFSILFMIVESDLPVPYVHQAIFLQTYSPRGFLYSFLGLTCLQEAYSERVDDMIAHASDKFHVAWFALFLQVSAWSLCILGALYFAMGLFCLKRFRDKLVHEHRAKWSLYRQEMKEFLQQNGDGK
mmetsp:Transcript_14321/g.23170  ORF Transcript_14321/g.23170 Transcript_14321/m.23170 type:complete len:343 (+) Transcript_14321:1008-2036(+)